MQIKVIAVSEPVSKQGGKNSYNMIEVTFKKDGKTETKNLVSFANKDVYNTFLKAQAGEVYEVSTEKDPKGYWQWIACAKVEGAGAAAQSPGSEVRPSGNNGTGSRYETPEERAARQVSITWQSSIKTAADFLTSKPKASEEDLFRLADAIVAWVSGSVFDTLPKDELESELEGATVQ